ncbi:hypothetical protein [Sphingomonas colocasiae]|uniref:UrcA family protein n=1 Tax=Sphingomonas colocasiae TaxID=1848973 RepID=A0ABS7PXK1_9SPHN|nr:hypothetical protein [Sphingomonas colocasiae]MBY8825375.1 hypothetical protein [Sphingomonas colocasiae]
MMEALTYVMAILGCADGGGACTEVRLSRYRFADRAQCERAIAPILSGSTDVSYPTIAARCISERHYAAHNGTAATRATLASLQRFTN